MQGANQEAIQVFKFGGASVKDASAVQNMGRILQRHTVGASVKDAPTHKAIVVVVSAMGKTTNALEDLLNAAFQKTYQKRLQELYTHHLQIASELLGEENCAFLTTLFQQLEEQLKTVDSQLPYPKQYDSIISFGELISTQIIAQYLQHIGVPVFWADARQLILTDSQWQEANVDWIKTTIKVNEVLDTPLKKGQIIITQGFIGANEQGETSTLGREGSDFSAAILGYCLHAENVTIWKDVPGVLNADPKRVAHTQLYEKLPYQEAAEMTYYGASVIHPKTIKPLANKNIPLYVRSFINMEATGTCIGNFEVENLAPAIIFKNSQTVIKFEARDLSNIGQRYLSKIIDTLSDLQVNINLMMNTAVSFSICMNTDERKLLAIKEALSSDFELSTQDYLELVTIKNPDKATLAQYYPSDTAILTLRTANSFQFVHAGRL